jgi:hypothetical protein
LPSGASREQGCQIFRGATYQNGEKYTKKHEIYQISTKYTKWLQCVPNGHKIDLRAIKYASSIARPSKIYPNWDFWSGKPVLEQEKEIKNSPEKWFPS